MSQKPPEPSDKGTEKKDEAAPAEGGSDRPAPRGKPLVPRGLGLAGDTTRPPQPKVSFGEAEPLPAFEQDRETLPPPIPMEQLIAQMMQPEIDPGLVDTVPPPVHEKDTIRPRGDEPTEPPGADDARDTLPPGSENMRTTLLPRSEDTPATHQDSMATMPPPASERDDRDTLPPTGDEGPEELAMHGPLYPAVPPARESTASRESTSQAIKTAEAVFQELGVELSGPNAPARSGEEPPRTRPPEDPRARAVEEPPRSRSGEEPPRSRSGEEPPRTRPPEAPVRSRLISRPTPRGMPPVADPPPPPSSTAGRAGTMRRRPSEQGIRPESPSTGDRHTPSGQHSIPASERLNEVRERYEAQDYQGALALAESILADNPDHIAALGYAESCRQMLRQMYLSKIGDTSLIPHVAMAPDELLRLGLDLRAARLIASIDGTLTIDDVVGMSGLPPLDALKLLNELIEDGVIELDRHPRGRR